MKTISAAFLAMLNSSKSLVMADLYTITLRNGTVLRYTGADVDIVYSGNTYLSPKSSNAPGFQRGNTRCAVGLNVDSLEVDMLYDSTTRINSLTPASFTAFGGFDNCKVQVDKALAPDWSNPVVNGVVNLFTGVVAEAKIEAGKVALTVNSALRQLNTQFPRNYFLPQCNHALFDRGCTLNKASYAFSGTVGNSGGSPTTTTFSSNSTQADGYFALGYVTWVTGANAGITSPVKWSGSANGAFVLIYPLASAPAVGDTFTAYPGCDKTYSTCSAKFNNLTHFRGYPYVPTPEMIELGGSGSTAPQQTTNQGASIGGLRRGPGGQNTRFTQQ